MGVEREAPSTTEGLTCNDMWRRLNRFRGEIPMIWHISSGVASLPGLRKKCAKKILEYFTILLVSREASKFHPACRHTPAHTGCVYCCQLWPGQASILFSFVDQLSLLRTSLCSRGGFLDKTYGGRLKTVDENE